MMWLWRALSSATKESSWDSHQTDIAVAEDWWSWRNAMQRWTTMKPLSKPNPGGPSSFLTPGKRLSWTTKRLQVPHSQISERLLAVSLCHLWLLLEPALLWGGGQGSQGREGRGSSPCYIPGAGHPASLLVSWLHLFDEYRPPNRYSG